MEYHLEINGEIRGPFTENEIIEMASHAIISSKTPCSQTGRNGIYHPLSELLKIPPQGVATEPLILPPKLAWWMPHILMGFFLLVSALFISAVLQYEKPASSYTSTKRTQQAGDGTDRLHLTGDWLLRAVMLIALCHAATWFAIRQKKAPPHEQRYLIKRAALGLTTGSAIILIFWNAGRGHPENEIIAKWIVLTGFLIHFWGCSNYIQWKQLPKPFLATSILPILAPLVLHFASRKPTSPQHTPTIIGHRGACAYAPENTLASIHKAVALNVDAVEIDVRSTRDGKLLLLHDETLDRTTPLKGPLQHYSWPELEKLQAPLTTLEDALKLMAGLPTLLFIEIKEPGIEPALLSLVKQYNMEKTTVVGSFHAESVVAVRHLAPHISRLLLIEKEDSKLPSLLTLTDPQYIGIAIDSITPALVQTCKDKKLKVWTWTVRTHSQAQLALQCGVDGIIADDPALVRSELGRKS